MGFFDWLLSMRKKPLEERRRFVALFTVVFTAAITALWLFLMVTVGPLKLKDGSEAQSVATPINIELPDLPPFPDLPPISEFPK